MKIIQFIYNDTIIAQQNADMYLNQVDEVKWLLADAYKCFPDEIETRYTTFELNPKLSNYDVTNKGIVCFNSGYPQVAKGIVSTINENSDEFVDAMIGINVEKFIEKHLHFKF
jgi:hypothetical protein